ncbi:hypothetical protein M2171_005575 [Bradyrhizobium japonicum USDA 38]|uniref:hypothetical protein n=1 Tax=Bradyrhizobium japonicum TaxID=375 RepID=UPI00040CC964|nr:hypothetical protein [Bradyrhizobium japonicum]MCS3896442.1 hypothetical protein [Bradyrhizobium japonicum USDA 38]MCS3948957.1 hypothetical protein [Bradyrhizobium japonicum]
MTKRKPTSTITRRTKKAATKPFPTLTQGHLGALIGTSQQRVSQLLKEGLFSALPGGKIDPFAAVPAYCRAIRKMPDENMARIRAARAREIEQRVLREERKLVPLADVNEIVTDVLSTFRSELSGLPAACTRDLEQHAVIEANLNDTIDRCRQRFEAKEKALRNGEPLYLDEVDDDED